jgi:polyhydroxyalkanoate synthesis regulator phasin
MSYEWNANDSALRTRLLESMTRRAEAHHQRVSDQLVKRQEADVSRAREIFAAFRRNLHESLDLLTKAEQEAEMMLLPDEQQRQRRRDIDAMRRRLDELGDEEAREVAAITDRYREVKPHTTAAAIVFALTPGDARQRGAN